MVLGPVSSPAEVFCTVLFLPYESRKVSSLEGEPTLITPYVLSLAAMGVANEIYRLVAKFPTSHADIPTSSDKPEHC